MSPTNRRIRATSDLVAVDFEKGGGLVPVVSQDASTGSVLMVAWANRAAVERTLETGEMHYWSRSRNELWRKGETSGAFQRLRSLHVDCDGDTLLARVQPEGPACHTGEATCFGGGSESSDGSFAALDAVVAARARDRPKGSYTARLLEDTNLRVKKLGEEVAELVAALAQGEGARATEEAADLIYHLTVALRGVGVSLADVADALEGRAR